MSNLKQDHISRIVIKGYKSIKECDLGLNSINVLIGSNGAGKSNFVSAFSLLQAMLDGELSSYAAKKVASTLFFDSPKATEEISLQVFDGAGRDSTYRFVMAENDTLVRTGASHHGPYGDARADAYRQTQKQWRVYHFHDTGTASKIKLKQSLSNNDVLRGDASNLSVFLYHLRTDFPAEYRNIQKAVQRIAPYFKDFVLEPEKSNLEFIQLKWQEKGCEDNFYASQLSDGTLRFICIATLLLQPTQLQPAAIIIDEPELGLHPYAITIFAELVKKAATKKQIIMSTQSAELLDHFEPEDVIVVDRSENGSEFKRLDAKRLAAWLEDDYSLGELWNKNLFGGRISR